MKALTRAIGLIAAIAVWLAPAAAAAEPTESVVPPENSAATQYTEALPTAGGNREPGSGGKGEHRSPAHVLGTRNAHRLESQGKSGREVAEVVAETAPSTSAPPQERQAPTTASTAGKEAPGNGKSGGTTHAAPPDETSKASQSPSEAASGELPSGSSGLGEVLAAATGSSSSGQPGFLLPLAIAAAIAWAIAYLLRQRRRAG